MVKICRLTRKSAAAEKQRVSGQYPT